MNAPEPAARAALAAVIERDIEAIGRVGEVLVELPDDAGYERCAGVAYALHNLYCALENSFDQISRTFENHIVEPTSPLMFRLRFARFSSPLSGNVRNVGDPRQRVPTVPPPHRPTVPPSHRPPLFVI